MKQNNMYYKPLTMIFFPNNVINGNIEKVTTYLSKIRSRRARRFLVETPVSSAPDTINSHLITELIKYYRPVKIELFIDKEKSRTIFISQPKLFPGRFALVTLNDF